MKKWLKFIGQFAILTIINEAGALLMELLHLPIPGSVAGILILFVLLSAGLIPLEWVEGAGSFLLRHLSFFFIPIAAGLMTLGQVFLTSGIKIIITLMVSTMTGMAAAGISSQSIARMKERKKNEQHHHHL
ncbi:CidA/LrgA family protein [Heyndrickxia acidicola]|uniref:CidA/LrgA family protein n=1 Tax=Heyndrickxia acidicola TaxID=209389 RepID=A0ABU6MAN8_9BACI|nr:CidA/LrgA family protein [Heyndrickxia acidicola]MED1201724.1 CidA/LrgA family protein [Heyndrickxia acidicola]